MTDQEHFRQVLADITKVSGTTHDHYLQMTSSPHEPNGAAMSCVLKILRAAIDVLLLHQKVSLLLIKDQDDGK